jgi:periodic tryptophan protein 2
MLVYFLLFFLDENASFICIIVSFNPLGDWIALVCRNVIQLVVWEGQSQIYVLKKLGHFNNMTQLVYSSDGMHIASGGNYEKVCWICF